jgi:hypothetical protein
MEAFEMARPKSPQAPPETDPRFPSGAWTGFYLQGESPRKLQLELNLAFAGGNLKGEGRDYLGKFRIKGTYQVDEGICTWTMTYYSMGSRMYRGFNEGKGIWGTWKMEHFWRGGFYIWPVGMPDPTGGRMRPFTNLGGGMGFSPWKDDAEPTAEE